MTKKKRGRSNRQQQIAGASSRRRGRSVQATRVWNTVSGHQPVGDLPGNQSVHRLVQTVDYGVLFTSSSGGEVDSAVNFKFSDLTQQTSLSAIFDQYMIEYLEVFITPTANANPGGALSPRWLSVVDYDDANALTFNSLLQYESCEDCSTVEGRYIKFRPHQALAAYQSTFGGFANVPSMWNDSGSPAVQHYGIKTAMTSAASTFALSFRVRFHMAFRNVL